MNRASGPRYFELDENLHTALVNRAGQEHRPAEDIHANLGAAGLAQLQTSDRLKERWDTLTQREKEVTPLTCLGYTNRQMAGRLGVSPETVKGYVKKALVKYQLHSKDEMGKLLAQWDFSEWGHVAKDLGI